MVADQKKDGNIVSGQAVNALGELALLGLGRLTGLIGITAEEDEVNAVVYSIVYYLVQSFKEIFQARG